MQPAAQCGADQRVGTVEQQPDTEIIFDLEEEYGIEIEMNTVDAWSSLKNVGDMVEAVRVLIAKSA